MTRLSLIVSVGLLSFGAAACGDYEANEAAYNETNAAYGADNAAYDAGNAAYDASDNAAYDAGNAAYPPPADGNVSANDMLGTTPPADTPPTTNGY